jgi:hypothetical protein
VARDQVFPACDLRDAVGTLNRTRSRCRLVHLFLAAEDSWLLATACTTVLQDAEPLLRRRRRNAMGSH